MVAGLAQGRQREELGRLAARCGEGRDPALERRDPLLEDIGGGVGKAGVDVAELGEGEEAGAVGGVVKGVGSGLVDRHGAGVGARSGRLAGVELEGFKAVVVGVVGHVVLPFFVLVGRSVEWLSLEIHIRIRMVVASFIAASFVFGHKKTRSAMLRVWSFVAVVARSG